MTGDQVRKLLDLAWDQGARADNGHVKQWTQLFRLFPIEPGFKVRIAEKFNLIVPPSLPLYAKEFLRSCESEKKRFDQLGETPPSLTAVERRRYIEQLISLAGLDTRERRYVDQLHGFFPFTQLKQIELAEQERISAAAVAKRVIVINRKLSSAAYLSQLSPSERFYAFLR